MRPGPGRGLNPDLVTGGQTRLGDCLGSRPDAAAGPVNRRFAAPGILLLLRLLLLLHARCPLPKTLTCSRLAAPRSRLGLDLEVRLENLMSLRRSVILVELLGGLRHKRRSGKRPSCRPGWIGRFYGWRARCIGFQLLPLLEVFAVLLSTLAEPLLFLLVHRL